MIYTQNYSTPENSKRPASTGQNPPTTLRTPLDYSENAEAGTKTENLATEHPNRHPNSRSLLMDTNSLYRKKFPCYAFLNSLLILKPNCLNLSNRACYQYD